ncbi:thioredoxin domain-containing protein [Isoptericola sp. b490]|uniref:thioredoxin domain-containing protein n=1 Tax=Actinotalea lenta TaxID=3064654 RepID=UPI002713587B|nr:thioredoxin domain-containing protein [Isoptericola sp. b490]MDO8120619.1 thioredoxin domain-containing protein [Isoptericola sp. b490]
MAERLRTSTSPYLRQHADNPVDWWEWGPEAFAEARRRDVPVMLSVGYAACHWCHVMAHESFEDPVIADLLNRTAVAVKVDREERPDVDATYMAATQALTGQGGWPMTVWLTPEGRPFFAGTYHPSRPLAGMPSFRQVVEAVTSAWAERRGDVIRSAAQIGDALRNLTPPPGPGAPLHATVSDTALAAAQTLHDTRHGGFGGAPKFPPSAVLEWLLRRAARGGDRRASTAGAMAQTTLEAMARGGIYDQLGGGFARYAVDATWTVPHFEKMLVDNAQLLRVYLHWWRASDQPLARRVVAQTADWLIRELRTAEGAFASSLDADSPAPDGTLTEGAYYVWTPGQVREVLGDQDGRWATDLLRVFEGGSFEAGTSVLRLPADPDDPERWADVRDRLRRARDTRPAPARDDKVVAAWNGLAIAALAEAGGLLDRPDWLDAASGAADLLLAVHVRRDGGTVRLARTSRDGVAGSAPGLLEDYADLAEGLLSLGGISGERRYLDAAGDLLDAVLDRFTGAPDGALRDTATDEADPMLATLEPSRELTDAPAPSGTSAAAGALLHHAALTGSARHRRAAEQALAAALQAAPERPTTAGWALAVLEAYLDGPREVAVIGPTDDPATHALRRTALASPAPGLVLAVGPSGDDLPLLADRAPIDRRPTAYACRGFVCDRPTVSPDELAAQLAR